MKLSFAAFFVLLRFVQSQEERSQSNSLRQGGGDNAAGNPSSLIDVNAVKEQKSNDFEADATPPSNSNHRLLEASYWEEVATFDELENSNTGGSRVSISGDGNFLAAAPGFYSGNGELFNGIVRFFQKQDGAWKENTDLRLLGDASFQVFGCDISLSGNGQRVAIGANGDAGVNDDKTDSGSVSIYDMKSDGKWGEPLQVVYGKAADDYFGDSVALSKDGETLAIGSPRDTVQVTVYQWDDGTSSFEQKGDHIIDAEARKYSGFTVSLSQNGSVLAIGTPSANDSTGKVRVFYWEPDESNAKGGSWKQRGSTLVGSDAGLGFDYFGQAVDLSDDGKILAVGAGEAKVFQWKDSNKDDDEWEQIGDTMGGGLVSLATPPSSDSTILALGPLTFKLGDDGQSWEKLAGEVPGAQVVSLSSDGQTLAVGFPNLSNAVTVYRPSSSDSPTSGSNGDPHFRTWNGGHFEYHGQCDMILVKDEDFADGLGLEVQIRTKLVKFWSFIQNAAIRIGDDVLEMQGSPDLSVNKGNNHYWVNSVYQGEVTTLGGFSVKANYAGKHMNKRWFFSKYGGGNKISRSFEIDLSSRYPGQKIVIGSYKEFVRVDFHNAQSDAFGNSVGMLGDFATGKTLA
eukprot:scaffold8400_cov95-Cylindrotheca_fusiformis.AAC.1